MSIQIYNKDVRDAFFDRIYDLAREDKDLVFITADAGAFSLQRFKKDFPERFINVGVAEQTMVLLATGLAMSGKKVFIYSIIPFITQRALEHIKVNICSMNLPVTIVGCGAGLSFGFDGPTHHANQDVAAMKSLPGIKIFNPSDAMSSMASADESYQCKTPSYVRLDKGRFEKIYENRGDFKPGVKVLISSKKSYIVSTGFMTTRALEVSKSLLDLGIEVGVIDVGILKPLNKEVLRKAMNGCSHVFVMEEHSAFGGLSSSISSLISEDEMSLSIEKFCLPDSQIFDYGDRSWLLDIHGLSVEKMKRSIYNKITKKAQPGGE